MNKILVAVALSLFAASSFAAEAKKEEKAVVVTKADAKKEVKKVEPKADAKKEVKKEVKKVEPKVEAKKAEAKK